jgi:ACS family tartrate transporter-like MFS transporter
MIGWVKDQTGSFAGGLYFVAGLLVISAITTLILSRSQKPSGLAANAVAH